MQIPPIDDSNSPLSAEQAELVNQLIARMNPTQTAWLGGYLSGVAGYTQSLLGLMQPLTGDAAIPATIPSSAPEVTILFGTQSGNSEKVAKLASEKAAARGLKPVIKDMSSYRGSQLKQERNLLAICSTHGEGDPPDRVVEFYKFCFGKRAPKIDGVNFSVCALGDKTYQHYCKIGRDFDARFEELGGTRVFDRVDCDVDFEDDAEAWAESAVAAIAEKAGAVLPAAGPAVACTAVARSAYDKKNPFPATLLEKIVLNDEGSAKETLHIELSLEDSGLNYKPGDAVGVYPTNDPATVDHLITVAKLDAGAKVSTHDGEGATLREALSHKYDITALTPDLVKGYAGLINNDHLTELTTADKWDELQAYISGRDLADMIADYPGEIVANDLLDILRKLQPRLYSIASSFEAYPDEVHLCIAAVRYESHGRQRHGVCSTWFADRTDDETPIPVYIHENNYFRLPEDDSKPIIMIGPGTGIAPFRAFLQEREIRGASGNNWLFFGDQHFDTDFLYQAEWHKFIEDGLLTKMDVAFSRDQEHKIYVQDRLRENGAELCRWIRDGAHVYVCGDESRMAHDVHAALINIIAEQDGMDHEVAVEYVGKLQKENRYQRDVY